jgi:carboxymethylenebutenolidase
VRITLPGGTPAELVSPDGAPSRGIALHPDIGGLRPLFDDLCARLASEHGWAVCAIEPWPGQEDMPLEQKLEASPKTERVLADLVEAADATGAERVAVLGFCMGGMQAFRAAGTGRFDRAVAFYGMVTPPPQWRWAGNDPLDALARPEACPTLAIMGGRDQWTPEDDLEALRRLPNAEVAFYPDAEHGFVHDPSRPAHRPDDAADAWRRVTAFLA